MTQKANKDDLRKICFLSSEKWNCSLVGVIVTKGQLISKCLYEVIISPKYQRRKFDNFCPERARAEIIKKFRWYFGRNDDFIKTF